MKSILALAILLYFWTFTDAEVVKAKDEADVFRINDEYPSKYSVVIFVGAEHGLLASISGAFGETKHQQQERELQEIIQFFEKESHYEIPIIEANVDNADFSNIRTKWNVTSIPWIVILDENNVVSYSKEPIEEADEEILLVMNIFPTTFAAPPTEGDVIIFDDDDEPDLVLEPGPIQPVAIKTPPSPKKETSKEPANEPKKETTNTSVKQANKAENNDQFPDLLLKGNKTNAGTTELSPATANPTPGLVYNRPSRGIPGELRLGPQLYGDDIKRNQRWNRYRNSY